MTTNLISNVRRSLASSSHALMLVLAGCAPEAEADPAGLAQVGEPVALDAGAPAVDAGVADAHVSDDLAPKYPSSWPTGLPKVVRVGMNGTGCPRGTARVDVSPTGTLLTVTFSALEVASNANQSIAVKDCRLVFTLQSAESFRYTANVVASGFGYLEQGAAGLHLLRSSFTDAPAPTDARAQLNGPFDDWYKLTHTAVPSNCATQRDLTVRTMLRLSSAAKGPRGQGYLNLSAAHPDAYMKIELGWERCE